MTGYLYETFTNTTGLAQLEAGDTFTITPTDGIIAQTERISAGDTDIGLSLKVAGDLEVSYLFLNGGDYLGFSAVENFQSAGGISCIIIGFLTGGTTFDNAGAITAQHAIALDVGGFQKALFNSGTISAATGVMLRNGADNTTLMNTGTISACSDGIAIQTSHNPIQNDGAIRASFGAGIGISDEAIPSNLQTINNTGRIESATFIGVNAAMGDVNASLVVNNSGVITGGQFSIATSGPSKDHITNSGTLNGTLFLSAGNDTYTGHGGFLNGDAQLGDGSDLFDLRGGAMSRIVYGGTAMTANTLTMPPPTSSRAPIPALTGSLPPTRTVWATISRTSPCWRPGISNAPAMRWPTSWSVIQATTG